MGPISLYGLTRRRRPGRYIEVGSGQSTKVVARARRDGDTGTTITSVDPHPRSEVDGLCDRVVRLSLERADLADVFADVERGDIVFFDGSRRVLPDSDYVGFFLDVLPSLPPVSSWGYPTFPARRLSRGVFRDVWSEQYVLAALLLAGAPRMEVVLPTFYASGQPD